VRIATWNVNGLRARLPFLLAWLAERQPDVVGLQELKATNDQFPRAELAAAGYHAVVHGQAGWNGVAVLSREAAEPLELGLPGHDALGARLVTARVGALDFTTLYVPNGKAVDHGDFPLKLAWLDALAAHLREACDAARPRIVCGDLNVCPAPLDSWNEAELHGSIFHTDAERGRFAALLDTGLVDLLRVAHPTERLYTWWDYRGGAFHRGQGLRIDFLLGSPALVPGLRAAHVDREYRKKRDGLTPSDHAPVVVEFDGTPG